jgi:hypothetical protein
MGLVRLAFGICWVTSFNEIVLVTSVAFDCHGGVDERVRNR